MNYWKNYITSYVILFGINISLKVWYFFLCLQITNDTFLHLKIVSKFFKTRKVSN